LTSLSPNGRINGAMTYVELKDDSKSTVCISLENEDFNILGLSSLIELQKFLKEREFNGEKKKRAFNITEAMLNVYSIEEIVIRTLAVALLPKQK
jgi:hypothetical protein